MRKEGRLTHPWQQARLIGWNSIWVGQCDISAKTVYLQTSCWSLAQRSRLMTLEHDSKSEENCNLRSAKAGHSSNIRVER